MQLLRRMQTSLGSWLPSETPPMSGGLPFPPSCTTLLPPPPSPSPHPTRLQTLCKTLTCRLTARPAGSSPPWRESPCTLLRGCHPATHCHPGLVWLPPPGSTSWGAHNLSCSCLRSPSWCCPAPGPWEQGGQPAKVVLGLGSTNYGGWRQLCAAHCESQGALASLLLLLARDHFTVLSFHIAPNLILLVMTKNSSIKTY